MGKTGRAAGTRGTSLIEVVVAVGLGAVLFATLAPVTVGASRAADHSRLRVRAASAATSHLERLRALPWYRLPGGGLVIDVASRITDEGFLHGGPGLAPGPGDALDTATGAFSDEVTSPVPTGAADAVLARRWRVVPLPTDPTCLVLSVEVALAQALASGQPMAQVALARAQSVRCVGGARP